MERKTLTKILDEIIGKRILVIGDLMIDHYINGSVSRISPEAPVPVIDMKDEEYRLGGAANVALNIKSLGGIPVTIGIGGDDEAFRVMQKLFEAKNISTKGLVADESRCTTLKTRIVAGQQQVVRVDREIREDITTEIEDRIIKIFNELCTDCDAVIIEDYNKGLLTERVIREILLNANSLQLPVAVDPKYHNFFMYEGVTVFKPNFSELKNNMAMLINSEDSFVEAGQKLLKTINANNVMVTRGEKGLTVFKSDGTIHSIPSYTRDVFDVSGAGDTVISALTLSLAGGATIEEAAEIANYAAGVVCGKSGTSSVKPEEIIDYIEQYED